MISAENSRHASGGPTAATAERTTSLLSWPLELDRAQGGREECPSAPRHDIAASGQHHARHARLAPQSISYAQECVALALARVGVPPLRGRDCWPQGQLRDTLLL